MELRKLRETLENDYRIKRINLKQLNCYDKLFDEYVKFKENLFERSNSVKYDRVSNKVLVCIVGANSPMGRTFYEEISKKTPYFSAGMNWI